jgi:group I intron endonuclease
MKKWSVYIHTSPSGKAYIGITCDIKHRWRGNGSGYKGSTRIWYAILKYGFDNFKHDILYRGLTKAEAEKKEIELIKQYNSTDERFGYNLQQGGKIRLLTEESRKKLSDSLKGHKVDMDLIMRLAEQKSKQVVCIETGQTFKSIQEAADEVGVLRTTISKVINGKIETAGGYHWAIKGQEDTVVIKKRLYYNNKKVLCIDTGEVFDSVSEAGREKKLNRKAIANNCNGISKTAGGFKWAYI